jgi:methylenetetrahydrofolate dehydrogenase (NADP+)/methenyltetrahydrofolate cyclohydrolase
MPDGCDVSPRHCSPFISQSRYFEQKEALAMAQLIDGKKLAEDVVSTVKTETEKLVAATGVVPGIAVVIVGEDPASQVYVASKGRKAKECGFHSVQHDREPQ